MSTEMQTKVQASPTQNFTPVQTGLLQRKCTLCNTPGLVEDSERDEEKLTLQRSSADQAGTTMVPRFGHDFSKISVHSTGPGMIQTKLKINKPGDIYEQDADRVADQVMRMPEPRVQRQPVKEKIKEEEVIQAKIARDVTPEMTPAIRSDIQSMHGGGRPLSGSERGFFEPRFGVDFSNVRVHNDTKAASVAKSVNARAFTLGRNVVFGAGEFSSNTLAGRKLLAHELTHVMQQNDGSTFFYRGKNSENTIPNSQELGAVTVLTRAGERQGALPAMLPFSGSVLRSRAAQLMRTPDDLTEAATYPTEAERGDILEILDPQQQAAAQTGGSVLPVTNPSGFRQNMLTRMNNYIGQMLPRAQARQASSVTLGRTEILDLGDIVQPEVETFYGTYLTAAIHSPVEAQQRAGYQLRSHLHLVSDTQANVNKIACDWVVSRMLLRGADLMRSYHVLASGATAKESCPPGSPSTASGAANERDQALFESTRDDVFNAHQADLQTIILFQSSFEGGGEAYIQSHIEPRSGESTSEIERRGRWDTLGTIIHEMLHAVAHENFDQAVDSVEEVNIAKEGVAEYFTRPVYNALRARVATDGALRTSIEGVSAPFDSSLAPNLRGYQGYVDQVDEIKRILGGNEENLKVAYFMGHVEYIGLGGWNRQEASRREALHHPANQLGVAALLTEDGAGLLHVDYGRVVWGRGNAFQVTLGGTVSYLTDGDRLALSGTVGLQYSWPNVYVRGRVRGGVSVSTDQPFEESVRLDVMPDVEAGVRIGMVRIGAGVSLLIPVSGGPVDERVTRMAAHVGLSLDL